MLFKPDKFVEEQKEFVSERIKGKAIIACSGGVDSMVAAVIVSKAIGDRLLAVYVDTGLMRKGETDEVRDKSAFVIITPRDVLDTNLFSLISFWLII